MCSAVDFFCDTNISGVQLLVFDRCPESILRTTARPGLKYYLKSIWVESSLQVNNEARTSTIGSRASEQFSDCCGSLFSFLPLLLLLSIQSNLKQRSADVATNLDGMVVHAYVRN